TTLQRPHSHSLLALSSSPYCSIAGQSRQSKEWRKRNSSYIRLLANKPRRRQFFRLFKVRRSPSASPLCTLPESVSPMPSRNEPKSSHPWFRLQSLAVPTEHAP